jgi:predicted RNase H-like HicB family nuclease
MHGGGLMLLEYINEAMANAVYDKLEEGSFSGKIPQCPGGQCWPSVSFQRSFPVCQTRMSDLQTWELSSADLGLMRGLKETIIYSPKKVFLKSSTFNLWRMARQKHTKSSRFEIYYCDTGYTRRGEVYRYEVIIYWSKEDNSFVAEVPELPGCMADGPTYEDALRNAQGIIQEWLETARELGREIPSPKGKLAYA